MGCGIRIYKEILAAYYQDTSLGKGPATSGNRPAAEAFPYVPASISIS